MNIKIQIGEKWVEIDKQAIEEYRALPFDLWCKMFIQPAFHNLITAGEKQVQA